MNSRSSETQSSVLTRLDKNELKSIKVAITRRNVPESHTPTPLLRSLDDPAQLVVHYRPDEGVRPIFDRDDIIVNKENSQEERTVLSSLILDQKTSSSQPATSRSSSRSSRTSPSPSKFPERKRPLSPQPHTSKDDPPRNKEYYTSKYGRSSSNSRKAVYKTRRSPSPTSRSGYRSPARYNRRTLSPPPKENPRPRERSSGYRPSDKEKSPSRYRSAAKPRSKSPYRGPPDRRRTSRSPPPSHRSGSDRGRYSRSPHKYRGPPERKRSRSPPPVKSGRGRSRSHSPYHGTRSRYSRSPHRHEDYRRYERLKRSRSPRRHSRYSPERHSRRSPHDERHSRRSPHDEREYQGPKFPPYFEGAEFWIPDPSMQPRFIPRHMIPPAAFPYGPPLRPGIPMMMPPRIPFRPRIIYNRPPRPRPTVTVQAIESSTNTTTTTTATATTVVTSSVNDEAQPSIVTDESEKIQESEHTSSKKSDDEKNG